MGYDRLYFLKKAYAPYPGVIRPIAAPMFATHYRRRRAARGALRAMLDAFVGIGFHLWIRLRARKVQRRFGLDAAWRRRAIAIAHARFADPNDIALFRINRAEQFDGFIRRFEDAAFNKRINPLGWTAACALADKLRFAERCRAAGLPHAETIAVARDGRIEVSADPAGRALVVKPVDGEGGDGVRMLGAIADASELAARLHGTPGTLIVQRAIPIHPALADIALAALPTVRIVTIFDERGAPEIVSATFRCAADPAARVDNMKAGGLIAPVDIGSGRLGIACHGYGGGDHAHHPVTGAPIEGRILPDWGAASGLAIRAHAAAFADYALIGWDIAFTATGPVLIEGNGKPGVLMPQRAARHGLADTRYGQLLAYQLAMKA